MTFKSFRPGAEKKPLAMAAMALMVLGAAGCSAPRIVTKVTSGGDQVKLVYNRTTFTSYNTGVVQCKADAKGKLSNCSDLEICFINKKGKCEGNK